jgi:multiple sugar transport system substrate-binding protein
MRKMLVLLAALLIAVGGIFIVGCGDDDDGGGGGGEQTADAKKAPAPADKPEGDINVCIGKDTSGIHTKLTEQFNEENPGANAKLVELPESADEQRTQMVQRLRAESAECDLLSLDVIWTAEFAAQGWLLDMTDQVEERKSDFIPSTLETVKYEDKYWAMPYNSNAGFLFYRTDQVDQAPSSWEEVYEQGKQNDGTIYQGARYEGLTVHFLELLYSAGGTAISEDASESTVDSQEARDVVDFMVNGIKDGAVPKAVTTFEEEEARRAFENGNATFERQWPYAYTLGQEGKQAGNFDVAAFPGFGGNEPASVLGGYNLAVSAYSDNAESAVALLNFLTAEEAQIEAGKVATPPVVASAYDDPGVKKEMPFADVLLKAIEQGESRPATPVYPQVSEAIYKNLHAALNGDMSPDEAVSQMDEDITKALETF